MRRVAGAIADHVANIMGLNTCRVIAQSLGSGDYDAAKDTCAIAAPAQSREWLPCALLVCR
ncbi:hypothetical protein BH10PSE6_BH10PSE6_40780 [soil metagenome]